MSRAEVVAAVRAAEQSESWTEAFVATHVWGYGVTGYGPYRTRQVLAQPSAEAVLTEAVSLLVDEGAVAAYEVLNTLDGLGPAFLTKFLYFAGQALPDVKGPRPLILDSVLAGVLRRHATKVGRAVGYEWSEAIAKWIWRDSGWSSHRYDVYLRWMYAANEGLAAFSELGRRSSCLGCCRFGWRCRGLELVGQQFDGVSLLAGVGVVADRSIETATDLFP